MTDIRERLLAALTELVHDDTNPARVNAILAELPLTPAQLDGLASGDMVVVPREPTDKAMLKVLSDSGERYGDTFQGIGPLVWHYQALISAAQEEQP